MANPSTITAQPTAPGEQTSTLSPEFRAHLEEHCTHYASRRVGLIWVMQQLQEHYGGWLPDQAIYEAADIVGVPAPEVEGVATFFNWFFRHPVGREIITVCDSLPCWIGGCDRLMAELEQKLGIKKGETTPDGAFTLLPIVCLGNCDKAPTMMVGEELYDNVEIDGLEQILDRHRQASAQAGARSVASPGAASMQTHAAGTDASGRDAR